MGTGLFNTLLNFQLYVRTWLVIEYTAEYTARDQYVYSCTLDKLDRTTRFTTSQLHTPAAVSVLSTFSIISLRRGLVTLLLLCSCCHVTVIVLCFLLAVPWVVLWSEIWAFKRRFAGSRRWPENVCWLGTPESIL